ncbi:zinc-ribbon domain-containing protein, partial [Anaerotignum lactatifermentans]
NKKEKTTKPKEEEERPTETAFCPYCGAKAEKDYAFCRSCGKKL